MATTWAITPITIGNMPGQYKEPDILSLPQATSAEFKNGDVIAIASATGLVNESTSNPSGSLVGIAAMTYSAIYGITGTQPTTSDDYNSKLFGWSLADNTSSTLYPPAVLNALVIAAHNGQVFEGCLAGVLAASSVGASVGLLLDSSTDNWYVSTSAGNKVGTVVGIVYRPGGSVIGDTYARVLFTISASYLSI